jgi:hypothetical protein
MTTYEPIIKELEAAQAELMRLWGGLSTRQVRVHPPGGSEAVVTTEYADGLRKASDALNKAIHVLKDPKT